MNSQVLKTSSYFLKLDSLNYQQIPYIHLNLNEFEFEDEDVHFFNEQSVQSSFNYIQQIILFLIYHVNLSCRNNKENKFKKIIHLYFIQTQKSLIYLIQITQIQHLIHLQMLIIKNAIQFISHNKNQDQKMYMYQSTYYQITLIIN
ncbi:unnamed protein product [Paramecium sonneborni]|uniref:Uncharacterized protein n=1 Tax=Paramecium sonneborni TaxID=65129 RepID=A0A8S1MJL7_9CILI|nr:unnamed protein product [Paramecium sonneborni]